jgi:2,4-dienoyl-CoA reductase-like NADH-dependent reductase (Old Yellow Enzyme family)
VKHCHGYLLHELLSARERPGPYGGDLAGRMHFLDRVVEETRRRAPGWGLAVRLSAFDFVPFHAGHDGRGEPEPAPLPRPFGGEKSGLGVDLTDVHAFLERLIAQDVRLVCITAGSPYYNPHIQRPAFFPPSDGYGLPEDPLVGVARLVHATAEITRHHPDLVVVGSGYSYLQEWLPHVAQRCVGGGLVHAVGLGRMALSYPELPAHVLAGRPLDRRLLCRTFSDCTTAPRKGLISGCYPLDPFYRAHEDFRHLAEAKKAAKA